METIYYTPREVAEHLQLRVQTVYDYIRKGRLPAVRLGNRCRIAHTDLEAFLAGRRSAPSSTAAVEQRRVSRGKPFPADEASAPSPDEHRERNEAARRLLAEWMAEESGYDERVWPTVERLLQEHPVSLRQTPDGPE